MSFEVERVIEEHHPALTGHFPGNPIVPGVLIIDEVLQAVREWRGSARLMAIPSIKFTSPLEPGIPFTIELNEAGQSEIEFECRNGATTLASGTLTVERDAGES